jgi:hypothetical protein
MYKDGSGILALGIWVSFFLILIDISLAGSNFELHFWD